MKLLIAILMLGLVLLAVGQNNSTPKLPKYNLAAEAVYKGTIVDLRDRECPVSGGVGSHIIMGLDGKQIEVHLATVSFTKMIEMNLKKGDEIEVTGWKTDFEGVQTIFAREVRHGNEVYVFRAKDGTPAWMP
jgi:hypothetical protein